MKKLNQYILFITVSLFLVGCDGDTDNYLTSIAANDNLEAGATVRFVDLQEFTSVVNPSAGFDETRSIYDPADNVQSVSYNLIRSIGGVTDTVTNVVSSSTFPFDLQISNATLAAFAGIGINDLTPGDSYTFDGVVTRTDGAVFTTANTGQVFLDNSFGGYAPAMTWTISLACPADFTEAVGMYLITNDPFGTSLDYATPIEAVLNAAGNGIIFKDLFKHPEMYDVEFVFTNQDLGSVEIARQPAWHCDNFGCGFGEGRVDGNGSFFTCIGFVNVDLTHTVDAGSFGAYNLKLQKQ